MENLIIAIDQSTMNNIIPNPDGWSMMLKKFIGMYRKV